MNIYREVASSERSGFALGVDGEVGIVAFVGVEWRDSGRSVRSVVVSEFGNGKEVRPVGLLVIAVDPNVLFQGLVDALDLPVSLGVVSRGKVHLDVKQVTQRAEEVRGELGASVRRNVTRGAVFGEDMDEEKASELFGSNGVDGREKDGLFGEAVDDNQDRIMSGARREVFYEVHRDGVPRSLGNG